MSEQPKLPWRASDLQGFSTSEGPTFDGGWFTGGGPKTKRSLTVRLHAPQGRPATVELDLSDHDKHGCSVTLDPATARQAAAALLAAAEKAEAEMAHWRGVVAKLDADLAAARERDARSRAGLTP